MLHDQTPLIDAPSVTLGVLRALIAAGAGLIVAVPCYLMHNILLVQIDRMVLDMEAADTEITAYLTAQHGAAKGPP